MQLEMICPVRSPDLVWAVSVVHWLGSQNKNPKGMRDMLSLPLPEGQNESVIYPEELGSIDPLSALQGLTLGNYISQAALPAGSWLGSASGRHWLSLACGGRGEGGLPAPSPGFIFVSLALAVSLSVASSCRAVRAAASSRQPALTPGFGLRGSTSSFYLLSLWGSCFC